MALTGIIGAVGALVPALAARRDKSDVGDKTHPRFIAGYDAGLNDGRRAVDQLVRSRAQLVDAIELLERELAAERRMSAHWLAEAQRLIGEARERRERQQQAMAQYNPLAQAQDQQAFANPLWCNCVPSRAQVWGARQGLVQQLNDRST